MGTPSLNFENDRNAIGDSNHRKLSVIGCHLHIHLQCQLKQPVVLHLYYQSLRHSLEDGARSDRRERSAESEE